MATRARKADVVEQPEDEMASMSVQDLNNLIERATAARDGKIESAREEFINRTRAEAEGLGLSMQDLIPAARPSKAPGERRPVSAKYRDPNGAEWSGRGKPPRWIVAAEAEGKSRDQFLIKP
jgi:DNA-binding protein H-NS